MKYFATAALLALVATMATSAPSEDIIVNPIQVEVDGKTVQVSSYTVTIPGTSRAATRAITYIPLPDLENQRTAIELCKSQGLGWVLASPKSREEQAALESVLYFGGFTGNVWLGGNCVGGRWTWSDGSRVIYNRLVDSAIIYPIQPCGITSDGLMMFGPLNVSPSAYTWKKEVAATRNHVICQA